jgi:hypothetical protein
MRSDARYSDRMSAGDGALSCCSEPPAQKLPFEPVITTACDAELASTASVIAAAIGGS